MIGYIIISVLYAATFAAFMQVNKDNIKYWDVYSWGSSSWKIEMSILCMIGFFFWPAVILFILFYKVAFKFLNKNKK